MDMSLMSIDSFDDEDFIDQALLSNNSADGDDRENQSNSTNTGSIDISGLITGKVTGENQGAGHKRGLDFDNLDTPKICPVTRDRKRKNNARRCLSTDLNGDRPHEISFQEFRYAAIKITETATSTTSSIFKSPELISTTIKSPKLTPTTNQENRQNLVLDLTPEFNFHAKKQQHPPPSGKSKEESDATPRVPLGNSGNTATVKRPSSGISLQKCFSENHASIMRAVQISANDPTLIGDFTKTYLLPLIQNSKNRDLKSISCHVLAELLNQQRYADQIRSCTIIDCRYPYEYEGGHIRSAINLYTQAQILDRFIDCKSQEATPISEINGKRDILIFHCEFSSERGPSLCRFLRNKDRVKNSRVYPNLHYPEIYLLEGGYKEFYAHYADLCEPQSYRPMHHKDHENDLRYFRAICKSFDSKFGQSTIRPRRNR